MKASTQLQVRKEMHITVTLEMTVDEMDNLIAAITDARAWPVSSLKAALRESLMKARDTYSSVYHFDP